MKHLLFPFISAHQIEKQYCDLSCYKIKKKLFILLLVIVNFFCFPFLGKVGAVYAQSIAGGVDFSITLCADGTVRATGNNSKGQLGDGTDVSKSTPVQVSVLTGITAIAAGYQNSVALKNDGTVWTWGGSNLVSARTPSQIPGLTGITAIAAGYSHMLFLKSDGTVWGTGNNTKGQLGDGTTTTPSTPVQALGLTGIIAIATEASTSHSLALKNDGTVWAWGDNGNGELGDGTVSATGCYCKATPLQVHGPGNVGFLTGITAIAAGYFNSFALKNDGTMLAWGYNWYGQLGIGNRVDAHSPVPLSITGVRAIAAGQWHSLVLKNDSTMWTFGFGNYGQLGDGIISSGDMKTTPFLVSGLTGITAITGGCWHSLALKKDGTVWDFGRNNNSGQLGDNTIINRSTPVQMILPCNVGSQIVIVANAGPDQNICATTATMAGNSPITGTGLWTVVSGTVTITTPSSPTSGVTAIAAGTNILRWTFSNGPSSDDVVITRSQNPTTANAGPNQTICSGTATLGGNTPTIGTGLWTVISGTVTITAPSSPVSGITGIGAGVNTLRWTISNGSCTASVDDVIITRLATPTVTTTIPGSHCGAGAITLGATASVGTLNWYTASIAGTLVGTGTTYTTSISATTTYYVDATNGTCTSARTAVVATVNTIPTVAVVGNTPICKGSSTTLSATGASSYVWSPSFWLSCSNCSNPIASPTSSIIYTITGTSSGCVGTKTVTVTINQPPSVALAGYDQTICTGTATLMGNSPATGTGLWTVVSGSATITTTSVSVSGVTGIGVGANTLRWTISNGSCTPSTDDVIITRATSTFIIAIAGNTTICKGSSTMFSVTGANSYLWSPSIALSCSNCSNPTVNPTSSTIYTITGTTSGCVGTKTVTVTVNNSTSSSQTLKICAGQSLIIGASTYTASGTYVDVFSAANGCDSIVTTNLTVVNAITTLQTLMICAGQSITVGSNTYTTSGTYNDVLTAVGGCDSIVTTNLTVVNAITTSQTLMICAGQSVTVGSNTYTTSGTYNDVLTAVGGCDSIVTTNLTVGNAIDIITSLSGATITANQNGATYQWVDCNNNHTVITGENNQSYTPAVNGDYAVIATINGCSDTSGCVNVNIITGLEQTKTNNQQLNIYPNPNNGVFTIQSTVEGNYKMVNELGQTVQSFELNENNNYNIHIEELNNGVYFIIGISRHQIIKQKVVVWHF